MRKLLTGAFCLLLAAPAFAQATSETQLVADLANAQNEKANATAALATLDRLRTASSPQVEAFKRKANAYKTNITQIDDETQRYQSTTSAHNSRCGGQSHDLAFVTACNKEGSKLDTWNKALEGKLASLENDRRALEGERSALYATQSQIADEYARSKTALSDAERKIVVIGLKLESLPKGVEGQACLGVSPLASDEELKAKCGKIRPDGADSKISPASR
jgi:chromosome segregation ATPase